MKCSAYWGKTNADQYHRLLYHNLDVAACAIRLIERSDRLATTLMVPLGMDRDKLADLIGWATVLHDLGKLSPAFQYQSPATAAIAQTLGVTRVAHAYDVRHDSLGWSLWQDLSASMPVDGVELDAMDAIMRCATGHHGKPPSNLKNGTRISSKRYFGPADVEAGQELIDWSFARFAPVFPQAQAVERASWWIAGVITLADWLGSNTDWFAFQQGKVDVDAYFLEALAKADTAIDASGVVMPAERKSFSELFKAYTPTSVQQAVLELPTQERPFFLVIEETTGGGKTEAALAAAAGSSFFFGLPTMATANGLWRRVKQLEGQQSLLHSKRWMMPDSMDRATAWLNDSGRKSLLADIGVGTIDQAMIAAMYARYSTLRLAGLAAKTLIIDEVHAYDIYMKRILEVLIELHAKSGGSVILLSATLPLQHRRHYAAAWSRGRRLTSPTLMLSGFPLITFMDASGCLIEREDLKSRYELDSDGASDPSRCAGRRVSIDHTHSIAAVVDRIVAEAGSGKCVAWIRNTVGEAIDAFDTLLAAGVDVQLFHSRFTAGDRRELEDRVITTFGKPSQPAQRAGRVLVATQVIEQSLDIDFDFMVTDLCPVDLLIQRAGRLHRHDHRGDRGEPLLLVHAPLWSDQPASDWVMAWSSGTSFVYQDHAALWNTMRLVGDGFELPQDSRRLVEGVYDDDLKVVPDGLRKQSDKFIGQEMARATQGSMAAIKPDVAYQAEGVPMWDDTVAPTRLGEAVAEWVICEGDQPVNGSIAESTLQIRKSAILSGPAASLQVGPWQKTLNMTNGSADCVGSQGVKRVTYDKLRGLRY